MMLMVEVTIPPLVGVTDGFEKLQVEPFGSPEQVSATAELNPLRPVTVTVKGAGCPAAIVNVDGAALIVKSAAAGGGAAFAVTAANRPCISLLRPAVMYMVLGSPESCPPPPNTMSQSDPLTIGVPF